ncbi:MAG: hypothetical protein WBL65_13395 [Bryobacteraceae bacterium]
MKRAAERYDAGNLAAARLILADVDQHGGAGAGLVIWAALVLERLQPKIEGPLFRERRAA